MMNKVEHCSDFGGWAAFSVFKWVLPIAKPTRPWKGGVDWRDDGKASPLRYSFRAAGFWC
jgi:hypothetical protein